MDVRPSDLVLGGGGGRVMLFVLLIVTLFIFCLFFLLIVFISHRMTKPARNVEDWTPADLGLGYKEVSFKTEDGIDLKGWWMDKGGEKTLICLHGYTASRWRDVYMKPLLKILKEEDHNVLYFDLRAHGESGGDRTYLGFKEDLDLKASIDWLKGRHEESCEKIGLIGYSMGGIVAVRGLASDERVDCAVADSPPIDMDATSARSLKYFAGIPGGFYHLIKPTARLLFGIETLDMYGYAGQIDKPLLLIAGKNDPIVKVPEMRKFYEGSGDVVNLWITDAEHVRSIQEDLEEYERRISSFFEKHL
ncbi:MAG: alpha/beta fold hydrolase [Candidatus Thermoplasmatota archaeon]